VGDYRLGKINITSGFIQSLTLVSSHSDEATINYEFFPSEDAIRLAYLLGEVTEIDGISTSTTQSMNLHNFHNTQITKNPNYNQLVTLFFNNDDGTLSNKKLRLALMSATPTKFSEGQSAYLPYSPLSKYYNKNITPRTEDFAYAKSLLQPSTSSLSGQVKPPSILTIQTFARYQSVAQSIAKAWKNLGINTQIQIVDGMPNQYQVFLGDFTIPQDPDEYTLWHSLGPDNITHYKNLRIDDLLESGRETVDENKRKSIYDDFQKYLLDDAPAVFLYYPDEYTIVRK
jgi:peptide/nickel transport system substrate-binding protein